MKNIILLLITISISSIVWSQTPSENYIKTTTYQVETTDGSVSDDEKIEVITYHDGLGLAKQIISKQTGGNKEDNITPITYDDYGRQNLEYLPYSRGSSSLNYEDPSTSGLFLNLNNQYLANHSEDFNSSTTPNPYAQTKFENSPLSRIKEKAAAGFDWRYDESNVSLIDVDVPVPLNFSTNVDPLLIPDPSSNADAVGQVDVSITNTEINIVFSMLIQQSGLNVGQVVYLDTAPYILDDYFIGQLTDGSGALIPYFVQIQNNYLVITSTDPTYSVEDINCTLNLIVDIPPAEYTTYQIEESSNNTVRYMYGTNSQGSDIKHFGVDFIGDTEETELIYIDNYPEYALYKTVIKNENWQPNPDPTIEEKNHTTEEYKDKFGRIVLKRTYNNNEPHDTYYVYDKFGNLTYVIPPLASEGILVEGSQGFRVASQINYPWTDLVEIDKAFAEDYSKKLKDYSNEDLLNADLENEYGGQGGFTISTFENSDLVTLSLTFSATKELSLKQGELISLKDYGNFKDTELGTITGSDFNYYFIIKNNAIVIEKSGKGKGELININETFSSNTKLSYSKDYLWTTYSEVDSKFASGFEKIVDNLAKQTNQSILNTFVENEYEGQGGLNISIDDNDIITININNSSTTPLKLKQGLVIPLDAKRYMEDRELGSISGTGYDYYFAIRENSLFINGYGLITNLNTFFTAPPPPESPTIMPGTVEGLCYIYHYDYRNRVMNKKIPGKGWQYLVYDKLDRPVLIQDAKMRLNNQWSFTKYDIFNRIIYTGIYTYLPTGSEANEQLELQSIIDNQSSPNWFENKQSTAQTINGTTIYYSNNSYPTTNIDILSINYYDDYNFDNTEVALTLPMTILGQDVSSQVKTLSTGSKTRILGTDDWITMVTYYDDKSRPIYAANRNEYFNTIDVIKTSLDFASNILVKETSHIKEGKPEIIILDNYTYDHVGRLLTQIQSIDGNASELITNNTYNEYGQLNYKKVGGNVATVPENSTGLQTVDYGYNIRGWLKSINNGETLAGDLFGFKVSYNAPEFSETTPLFNGNISETHWITANDNNQRSYVYKYDALNRIKSADYHGDYTLVDFTDVEDYSLENIDYDMNGNIIGLVRLGYQDPAYGSSGIDIIDNLTYTYPLFSNKLTSVSDSATNDGFKDLNISDDDYSYDINGNLIVDKNKKIINIEYNHLNLPQKIDFDFDENPNHLNHGTIEYVYDANGVKLSRNVLRDGIVTKYGPQLTQYIGEFIYKGFFDEDATLEFINHPDGYIEPNESGNYTYIYHYKDHLENVRLSYKNISATSTPLLEIQEENNYYPFGLKHKGYNNIINGREFNYKTYQGQELTEDLGLNLLEFKWRMHDPAIGRFIQIDPLAENYVYNGTYNFAENRVVDGFELEGLEWEDIDGNELTPEERQKVKVYIFYDPKGPGDDKSEGGFSEQALKQYASYEEKYGEGSVALSSANTEAQFKQDWSDIEGSPLIVALNYHGSVQDIHLNHETNDYVTATGDGKTRKSQTEATDVSDLENSKADFSGTQCQLNTCNGGSPTHSTRGSGDTMAESLFDNVNFSSVRFSLFGMNFESDGTANPQFGLPFGYQVRGAAETIEETKTELLREPKF